MQEVSSTNRMNSRKRKMHPRRKFVVVSNEKQLSKPVLEHNKFHLET
jgi:hypothetical protein